MTDKTQMLLELGEPTDSDGTWPDYLQYGFEAGDVPALIAMATNAALNEADEENPEVWAPMHAWRTLGQLGSAEAVGPLVNFFDDFAADDWAMDEIPIVMGMIGESALEPMNSVLSDKGRLEVARVMAADALREIAVKIPAVRDRVVAALSACIAIPDRNLILLNSLVLAHLVDLQAAESIDVIRNLFKQGAVDPLQARDVEDVEIELGLRQQRSGPKPNLFRRMGLPEPKKPDGEDIFELIEYFLNVYGGDDAIMDASELDGFLAAIACSPESISSSVWLPAIWGQADSPPRWRKRDEADEFALAAGLLYNDVVDQLAKGEYEALFLEHEQEDGTELVVTDWCAGFLRGIGLWSDLSEEDSALLEQMLEPLLPFTGEASLYELPEMDDDEWEEARQGIEPVVVEIYHHFAAQRVGERGTYVRGKPKVGRNDPCPCGSGKKYKACCMK
ncbi:MAG: hypothetical protein A2286_01315 [Gammaproteobacteria bacterium RIFOXYA12_FULL_61_12]|nr:MAG: hypothetical protein A2286_01315 [Gammaproteobacteria bacterium RIFOXYA12_FULL_61_12]OGT89958.1 MAG: hypothetical protein A2514_10420 [Gammaproteobacteria bacterium RIFOXYD12_FULL_61_37]